MKSQINNYVERQLFREMLEVHAEIDSLKELLDSFEDIHFVSWNGWSFLSIAIMYGASVEIINYLLDKGIKITSYDFRALENRRSFISSFSIPNGITFNLDPHIKEIKDLLIKYQKIQEEKEEK
jgi:ankyrin repeat protein